MKEIVNALATYEKKLADFDPEYLESFKQNVQTILDDPIYTPTAERLVNTNCQNVMFYAHRSSNDYYQICLGDNDVNKERVAINYFLQTNFSWMNFSVVVMQHVCEPDKACIGDSTRYIILKANDSISVFITWSKPSRDVEKYVEEVKGVIQIGIKNNGGEWINDTDTSMIKSARKEIGNTLGNSNLKRIYCFFDADSEDYNNFDNNKYRRSIYTDDIASFGTQHIQFQQDTGINKNFWNYDYFVSYYA